MKGYWQEQLGGGLHSLTFARVQVSAHNTKALCACFAVGLAGEDKQAEVQAASTAAEMWKAIGKDSWVVVPIASTSRPGTLQSSASQPAVTTSVARLGMICI